MNVIHTSAHQLMYKKCCTGGSSTNAGSGISTSYSPGGFKCHHTNVCITDHKVQHVQAVLQGAVALSQNMQVCSPGSITAGARLGAKNPFLT